jgi:glucose-1-phosphate adenylyltransferase
VPFGGRHRIVDFVLSNLVNSGIYSIYLLVQYKSQSLIEHINRAWLQTANLPNHFVTVVPPQMREGPEWFQGTADAVHQNLNLIDAHTPQLVAVFGADHIYRMNVRQMIDEHQRNSADVTVAALPVRIEDAWQFGVMKVDADWRIVGFAEKPAAPEPIPGESNYALVSMGNYLFDNEVLLDALSADAREQSSTHDFGRDVLPKMINNQRVYAYDFRKNRVPIPSKGEEPSYWRDLGTLDAYYEASMDLCSIDPSFNLYNRTWPLRTVGYADPPAKFVFDWPERQGMAVNSIVAEGTIISGSYVHNCVVGRNVRIHSFSAVENSVIMDWVEIGRHCRIRNAIIDKANIIPSGTAIGYDGPEDHARYTVSPNGVVVLPRGPRKTTWIMTNP